MTVYGDLKVGDIIAEQITVRCRVVSIAANDLGTSAHYELEVLSAPAVTHDVGRYVPVSLLTPAPIGDDLGRTDPIDVSTLGGNIMRARHAAGLTQEALARRIDVSVTSVALWERDAVTPRREHFDALQVVLGLIARDTYRVTP